MKQKYKICHGNLEQYCTSRNVVKNNKGCVLCVLRPLILLGLVSGLSPIHVECTHVKNRTTCRFQIHKKWTKWSYVLCSTYLSALSYCSYDMILNIDCDSRIGVLKVFLYMFESLAAFLSIFASLTTTAKRIKELNGLLDIIEADDMYGLEIIFDDYWTNWTKKVVLISVLSIVIIVISNCIISIYWMVKSGVTLSLVLKILTGSYAGFSIMALLAQFVASCNVYNSLFKELHVNVRKILDSRKRFVSIEENLLRQQKCDLYNIFIEIITINSKQMRCTSICDTKLRMLRRLYSAYLYNIQFLNDFYNPTKLIILTSNLFSLIINIYILILKNFQDDIELMAYYKIICSTWTSILLLKIGDVMKNSAQEISSYLYSYPISGLDPQEAAEVEMYLDMLNTQKPILNASGIFNIGTGLLASISGTVVTYVLVALQFQVVWQEDTASNATNTTTTLMPN